MVWRCDVILHERTVAEVVAEVRNALVPVSVALDVAGVELGRTDAIDDARVSMEVVRGLLAELVEARVTAEPGGTVVAVSSAPPLGPRLREGGAPRIRPGSAAQGRGLVAETTTPDRSGDLLAEAGATSAEVAWTNAP